MAELDLEHFERRLSEERKRTLENLKQTEERERKGPREAAGALTQMPTHPADAGSETQVTEKDMANLARESDQIARIDEALRLIREEPELYEVCEECGEQISRERLEIVPWTRHCADCATSAEEEE